MREEHVAGGIGMVVRGEVVEMGGKTTAMKKTERATRNARAPRTVAATVLEEARL